MKIATLLFIVAILIFFAAMEVQAQEINEPINVGVELSQRVYTVSYTHLTLPTILRV